MSWQERIDRHITLTSPKGQLFLAFWQGNKRSLDKSVGIFKYPQARGAVVQDLDAGPMRYPLSVYFEGADHDLMAHNLVNAIYTERGPWTVQHPTRGALTLQFTSVTEDIQPVTSANLSSVEIEAVEVGVDNPSLSVALIAEKVRTLIDDTNNAAVLDFGNTAVGIDNPSWMARMTAAVNRLLDIVSGYRNAVLDVVNSVVMDVTALAGAVQDLITAPGMILRDIGARFQYFEGVIKDAAANISPKVATLPGIASAALHQLVVTAALTGMAQTVLDAEITTRDAAIKYLERMQAAFITATAGMDATQALYADSPVDQQYFAQSAGYTELVELMMQVRALLLRRSFDLAVAKRITLQWDRSPVEIALTEGVDLDSFIAANDLHGDDILLLPTGRQVVVYL